MNDTRLENLRKKRLEVLEAIKPICECFGIDDYDYIVKEKGQTETLRIYDTYIGCSCNSIMAVKHELIGFIFIRTYCRYRSLGAFDIQTKNHIRQYWLNDEQIKANFGERVKE